MRVGVDIGGTKILALVVDESGAIIAREKIPTRAARGYGAVRDSIAGLVLGLLGDSGVPMEEVRCIGVACAGQIDRTSRNIIVSPNLKWENVPLQADLSQRLGKAIVMDNDANVAAYGEWRLGLGGKPDDVLGVFIGTGIGGGLILGRRLYRGAFHAGAEVGHMCLNPAGYRCNCGGRGCLEAYAGGSYVVGRVRRRVAAGYRGKIWDIIEGRIESLHTGHIEEASLLGDRLCRSVWREAVEYLGYALAGLANLLNPEYMVLGGGVVSGSRYLVEEVQEIVQRRAMAGSVEGLRVVRASLGDDAAALGAAFLDVA